MIYLLHFDPPIGRTSHYLGCCKEDRLQARLREHALGEGARLIAYAVKHGRRLWLARTFPGAGFEMEAVLKRHGRFRLMCPLCCPMFSRLKLPIYEIDTARPEQPPQRAVLDWRTVPRLTIVPKQKRGRT